VELTSGHSGGNTHFGAFILLIPLIQGGDIPGAVKVVQHTDTDDAVEFYRAFGLTSVRILARDELDVNDPGVLDRLRARNMTLLDVMRHSAENDMVAREWVNGFERTRRGADLLREHGCGRASIVKTFLSLLAEEPDTLVIKKLGSEVAQKTMEQARDVLAGKSGLEDFDRACIAGSVNPGSTADLIIASIYVALGEGWRWDC
jgi:triphosphoribosyl-dephospho-CoA synthase